LGRGSVKQKGTGSKATPHQRDGEVAQLLNVSTGGLEGVVSNRPSIPHERQSVFRVDIDQVIIEGFALKRQDASLFKAAMEEELERLIKAHGLAFLGRTAVPSISAGSIELPDRPDAKVAGRRIALALYSELRRQ
jgi:hypothetical protein